MFFCIFHGINKHIPYAHQKERAYGCQMLHTHERRNVVINFGVYKYTNCFYRDAKIPSCLNRIHLPVLP